MHLSLVPSLPRLLIAASDLKAGDAIKSLGRPGNEARYTLRSNLLYRWYVKLNQRWFIPLLIPSDCRISLEVSLVCYSIHVCTVTLHVALLICHSCPAESVVANRFSMSAVPHFL